MLCAKFGWNWHSDSGKEDENAMISSQTATDYAIADRKFIEIGKNVESLLSDGQIGDGRKKSSL